MKKTLAAAAVLAAVLAPAAPASAAAEPYGTGQGKALGNCQQSSAGGNLQPLEGVNDSNPGNGGLRDETKMFEALGYTGCPLKTKGNTGGGA